MASHTIKVFTVFFPDGTVRLQYIHHNGDHPTEDEPGTPLSLKVGERIRWKSMNNAPIVVRFDASPFVSGDLNLPTNHPQNTTVFETVADVEPAEDGTDPNFKYTVTIKGLVEDDPDLAVDLGSGGGPGGGGAPHPRKRAGRKPASRPRKRR